MITKLALLLLLMATTVELQPGDKAPDFTAEATDGSHISLHQYKGKNVVLYFYPEDMTRGCTVEACNFRDALSAFTNANTVILGVSMDDRAKHEAFTKKENLNFPLLVDKDSAICHAYGVPIDFEKYPARWTFLIGKNGEIVQTYHEVHPKEHSVELLRDIYEYNKTHASN
jgi:peroxiredoxin Q/BCP